MVKQPNKSIDKSKITKDKDFCIDKPLCWIKETLDLKHYGDSKTKVLVVILLIATYFKMATQIIIRGESSSGKSNLLIECLEFIKRQDYKLIIGSTPGGLKRIGKFLDGAKIFAVKELDGMFDKRDAIFFLKMFSPDDNGGIFLQCGGKQYETLLQLEIPEKVTFITTFAKNFIDPEMLTRLWVVEIKQTHEHFKKILNNNIFQEIEITNQRNQEFDQRIEHWKKYCVPKFIERNVKVHIPFLTILRKMFTQTNNPRILRDAQRFRKLIEIIALIHASLNESRQLYVNKSQSYYIAEPQDFVLACELAWDTIEGNLNNMTPAKKRILSSLWKLWNQSDKRGIKPKDICTCADVNEKYGKGLLKELNSDGFIEGVKISKVEKRVYTWKPNEENPQSTEWTRFLNDIEKTTKAFFRQHGIQANLQEIYHILDREE